MKHNKQDRRSQRTRHLVIAALNDLLQEKRYEAITVQDLLMRANIGRSTFYTHYFDKADVLTCLMEHLLETWSQSLATRDTTQELVPSSELFRHAKEQFHHFHVLLHSHEEKMIWDMVQTVLSNSIEQMLTTAGADLSPPIIPVTALAQYVAGAFLALLKWWLAAEMPYSPEQMDRIFQQLTLPGIRASLELPRERGDRGENG